MAASSHSLASKARAAPIRRADEDSDSASSLECHKNLVVYSATSGFIKFVGSNWKRSVFLTNPG